jgi:hypothetical protein
MDRPDNDPNMLWFRELLHKVISWGVAGLLLTAGWFATGNGETITPTNGKMLPYLTISWTGWLGWVWVVLRVHKRCPVHPTIPRRKAVYLGLAGLTLMKLMLDAFVCD